MKAIFVLPMLLVLLVACSQEPTDNQQTRESAGLPIQAVEIQPRDLSRRITVTGRVEPLREVRLAVQRAGVVADVAVEIGDRVSAGDELLSLDVAEERAELARAEAARTAAERQYQRVASLQERGDISEAEYQRALAERDIADADLRLWQTRVEFGRIYSPLDATVLDRMIEPGEAVDARQPVLLLADLQQSVVRIGVSEIDSVYMQAGQSVQMSIDALGSEWHETTIRRVYPAADNDSRLITVEVALPDTLLNSVKPGFLTRVRLLSDVREDRLAVPAGALGFDSERRPYVLRIQEEKLQRVDVEPGVERGGWLEITSGLESGDHVLATNPMDMNEGQRVRIVGWAG